MVHHVVYEDDEIACIYQEGTQDLLLITFGDMLTIWPSSDFYGRSVATKLGISIIGIVSKNPNWYPSKNITKMRAAIYYILVRYRTIITHGSSMGAYGAIKYSKLLGASVVIAYSPQWSIDPETCGDIGKHWQLHFRPEFAGMEICGDDTAGSVYIFSDPADPVDSFHRNMIAKTCSGVTCISVLFSNHSVSVVMSGTENFRRILDACIIGDVPLIKHLVAIFRRKSEFRKQIVIERGTARHAHLITRILMTHPDNEQLLRAFCSQNSDAVLKYICSSRIAEYSLSAADLILSRIGGISNKMRAIMLLQVNSNIKHIYVHTTHNTFLYYDVIRNECLHLASDKADGPAVLPVIAQTIEGSLVLGVKSIVGFLPLHVKGTTLSVVEPVAHGLHGRQRACEIIDALEGKCAFRFGDNFVSAEPDGTVICNRPSHFDWERFDFRVTL